MIILAKEYVSAIEDALPFIEEGKRCLFIYLDNNWHQNFVDLTLDNYDELAAKVWDKSNRSAGYCLVYCDCQVYAEGTKIDRLEPGSYIVDEGEVKK